MTGPSLPRPVAGSNAIGRFAIGISPIGDIPPFDVWQTIISQYANSPVLTTLIQQWAAYFDQTFNIDLFFDNIFNISTAQGYGLDVWGRILGVTRVLQVPVQPFFGFEGPSGASGDSFNTQAFFSGQTLTQNFSLSDASFQTLLFAKAAQNLTNCSIPSINKILLQLFPNRGNCFVTDGLNMTMTYTFTFFLTQVELAIVQQSGVLPRPAGVIATVVQPV